MSDTRPSGFYWIEGDEEPEPARWDAEAERWFLIGAGDVQDAAAVTVLGPVQGAPAARGAGVGGSEQAADVAALKLAVMHLLARMEMSGGANAANKAKRDALAAAARMEEGTHRSAVERALEELFSGITLL